MRFTLRQLQYFVAAGEVGSIRQASEALGVSQPAVSASVAQLETELGVDLLVRHHAQGVSLTTTGERFLVRANQLLSVADELDHWVSDATDEVSGRVNVDCFSPLAAFVIPSVCHRFAQSHPAVELVTHENDQAKLIERVRSGAVDIAITYDLGLPKDLHFESLTHLPPYVVLARDHPLAGKAQLSLKELANWPLILLDMPLSRDYFLSLFETAGLAPDILTKTSQVDVMRTMVGQGLGYALANVRPINQRSLDNKPLTYIRLTGKNRAPKLGLLSLQARRPLKVYGKFSEFAKERLSGGKLPGMLPAK